MAISKKSVTTGTNNGSSATVSVTTSESPSATQVGDLVIVLHGNDFYAISNMATPTATGSPTMNAVTNGTADGGASNAHIKGFWYVANTGGAQTISSTHTGTHDEEKSMTAYVLGGADTSTAIDIAANATGAAGGTSFDAPAVSPTSSDAYLIVIANTGGGSANTAYSMGAEVTEDAEIHVSTFYSGVYGSAQLSASGTTTPITITPAEAPTDWAAVTVAVKTATVAAAGASFSQVAQDFPPFTAPWITPSTTPMQLRGDRTTVTGLKPDAEAVAAAFDGQDAAPSVGVGPAEAQATFAGQAAGISGSVNPAEAQATFAGLDATVTATNNTNAAAEAVALTFAAQDAATLVNVSFTEVQATFSALDATVSTSGNTDAAAECATWAGAAQDATPLVNVLFTEVQISFTGYDATVSTSGSTNAAAECATFTFASNDATVATSTSGDPYQAGPQFAPMFLAPELASLQLQGDAGTFVPGVGNAQAESAAWTLTAHDAGVSGSVNPAEAQASLAGQDAGPSVGVAPAEAQATFAGQDITPKVNPVPAEAQATFAANDATVTVPGSTNVQAECASWSIASDTSAGSVGVTAGSASATWAAADATTLVQAAAENALWSLNGQDAAGPTPIVPPITVTGGGSSPAINLTGGSSPALSVR